MSSDFKNEKPVSLIASNVALTDPAFADYKMKIYEDVEDTGMFSAAYIWMQKFDSQSASEPKTGIAGWLLGKRNIEGHKEWVWWDSIGLLHFSDEKTVMTIEEERKSPLKQMQIPYSSSFRKEFTCAPNAVLSAIKFFKENKLKTLDSEYDHSDESIWS